MHIDVLLEVPSADKCTKTVVDWADKLWNGHERRGSGSDKVEEGGSELVRAEDAGIRT